MMTDNEFTNGVWEKYNNYVNTKYKDKFFIENQYKKIKFHRKLSLALNFIIVINKLFFRFLKISKFMRTVII